MSTGRWFECVVDSDYEINDEYPHNIRRKGARKNVELSVKKKGYLQVNLNRKPFAHHRIVALQFIRNDDPVNKVEVDHINFDRADNHISNLRWVSSQQNQQHRGSYGSLKFDYFNDIDKDRIEITEYGKRELKNYYYVPKNDEFYWKIDTGEFKRLNVYHQANKPILRIYDKNNERCVLLINKFKHDYGIK